jgi:hypothetical protein
MKCQAVFLDLKSDNFHTEETEMLGATILNLVATVNWPTEPEKVLCLFVFRFSSHKTLPECVRAANPNEMVSVSAL